MIRLTRVRIEPDIDMHINKKVHDIVLCCIEEVVYSINMPFASNSNILAKESIIFFKEDAILNISLVTRRKSSHFIKSICT